MFKERENEFLHDLCSKTLKLARAIRFAGIMDENGKLLVGKYRKNLIPLLSPTNDESSNSFYAAYQALTLKKNFESDLGDIHFQLTEFDKVTLITIPLNIRKNKYLCISIDPGSQYLKLISKIFNEVL